MGRSLSRLSAERLGRGMERSVSKHCHNVKRSRCIIVRTREEPMTNKTFRPIIPALFAIVALAQEAPPPTVKIPEPGVPQIMTLEGRWVRAAYNNEGYV